MNKNYLFPHRYNKIGWFLFVPGVLLGLIYLFVESPISLFDSKVFAIAVETMSSDLTFFTTTENNILNEISGVLIIIGAILIAFSKEKIEDEFISRIRLESLVWATYLNYGILLFTILFVYDFVFLWVLLFNMFTLLIFFIVRFNWAKYQAINLISDEE